VGVGAGLDFCRTETICVPVGIRNYDRSANYVIPVPYVDYRAIDGRGQ